MQDSQLGSRRLIGAVGAVAAGLGTTPSADAAVVHQEVDVSIADGVNDPYRVDFNGDATNEFSLFADVNNIAVSKVWDAINPSNVDNFAQGAGVINALDPGGSNRPANLALGTLISPGDTFAVAGRALTGRDAPAAGQGPGTGAPAGNFQVSHGPGYIGVQFLIGGATHYGYVGYEGTGAENDPAGHVFALGYEDVPDTAVLAGNMAAPGMAADFDDDDDVDGEDFLIWQRGVGLTDQNDNSNGDADGSEVVDGADFELWKTQFGGGAAVGAIGAVPEPTSLSLLAAGATGLLLYRRRRGST